MTKIRSLNARSSAGSEDITRTPLPRSANSRTISTISVLLPISTPAVGSSKISRSGSVANHFAKTTFGRKVLATGGSETAAGFTGIKTHDIKLQVLIISSVTAAIAGMLYAGRLRSGRFQLGEGDELSVIAAAVLGGTSLFGGFGSVVGSIVGALMIGLINNGLILMGLEFSQQLIARGVIIILAVMVARSRR